SASYPVSVSVSVLESFRQFHLKSLNSNICTLHKKAYMYNK
ncbi:hypothetical protein A2U01_0046706, partial [Trifolium medium]|nr:hypothetical protein [Trifolium medium]